MNDFSEIEKEIKRLRPVQTSVDLLARIERALAQTAGTTSAAVLPRRSSQRWNWISLGLGIGLAGAAAFVTLAHFNSEDNSSATKPALVAQTKADTSVPSTSSFDSHFIATGLTEVVYRTQNEGLEFSTGTQRPMRRMRYETRETLRWRDPQSGASLRVSYPSEQVVLTPISGQ